MLRKIMICLALLFTLTACSSSGGNQITMENAIAAIETELNIEVDREEKPMFQMIGANDGVIFYVDGQKVALYEYATTAAYNDAAKDYENILGDMHHIGVVVLETSNEDVIRIFESLQ